MENLHLFLDSPQLIFRNSQIPIAIRANGAVYFLPVVGHSAKTQNWRNPMNAQERQIVDQALAILETELRSSPVELTSSEVAAQYCRLTLGALEHEEFAILHLDNQHRLIVLEKHSRGTIDGAAVYPREVVKSALFKNAAAVIFTHNHPSGVAEPSHADIALTLRLKSALSLIDVRVLDHIIVSPTGHTSLAERGVI